MSHGAVFAEEELLAKLTKLEEGRGPIFLALNPLCLFFEILEQTGPISRTTKALRYLFPKLHEQATLIEFPGIWMVESRTFYTMCGDGDQLETGTAPQDYRGRSLPYVARGCGAVTQYPKAHLNSKTEAFTLGRLNLEQLLPFNTASDDNCIDEAELLGPFMAALQTPASGAVKGCSQGKSEYYA